MNAADIMTRFPATAAPDTKLIDLVHLMAERDVSALPIVVDGRLVGLVTHNDVIRALASREGASLVLSDADRRLRDAFAASLSRPPWTDRASHPTCHVDNGDIHLWGPVESEADQRALVALARSLPGVRLVTDHMTVLRQGDPFDRPNWPVAERP
jgi:CBS domain-containing protein